MPNEVVSKKQSNLAKLLAEENLTIDFASVSTASFNIVTRRLTLPIMKDNLSQELYDMFIGHEVGHALFTPQDYMNNSVTIPDSIKSEDPDENKMMEQNLKNILEDVRIEKNIQRKYPGLRRDFRVGYQELFQKNFFKTDGKNINSMGFLNKLNIYAKAGSDSGVVFSPEEQVLVDKAFATITFEDVIDVCQEVIDYVATKKDHSFTADSDANFSGFSDDEGGGGKKKEENDLDFPAFNPDAPPDELLDKVEKEDKEFNPNEKANGASFQASFNEEGSKEEKKEEIDDLDASTNEEFMNALQKLLSLNSGNVINYYLPTFKLENIIVPNKTFMDSLNKVIQSERVALHETNKRYLEYRNQNTPVIRYLVKEFELKKRAQEMQREQIYKTGNLDLKRVSKYQITPDIFRRAVFTPGGKSHGLQIFIDWSSSMDEYLYESIIQMFCITDFCRAVSIPFDVYSFRSGIKRGMQEFVDKPEVFQTNGPGHLDLHHFHLVHMLSSKQSYTQYVQTQKNMLVVWKKKISLDACYMSTISTPLNNCIVAAMQLIPKFKEEYNLQIVNSIFITDGSSDATTVYFNPHDTSNKKIGTSETAFIQDPATKYFEKLSHETRRYGGNYMTQELLQLLEKKTDSNVIGFFLTEAEYYYLSSEYNHPNNKQSETLWNNDGYAIQYGVGYTVHYCINIKGLQIKTETIDRIMKERNMKNNITEIEEAWSIQLNNKLKNRPMLTNFIQHIA